MAIGEIGEGDEEVNGSVKLLIEDNLPKIPMGKFGVRTRPPCDYCGTSHFRTTICEVQIDKCKQSDLSHAQRITLRDLLSHMKYQRRFILGVRFTEPKQHYFLENKNTESLDFGGERP